jgi:hypothetical protein
MIRDKDIVVWVTASSLVTLATGIFLVYMSGFDREFDDYLLDCEESVPKVQQQHEKIESGLRRLES